MKNLPRLETSSKNQDLSSAKLKFTSQCRHSCVFEYLALPVVNEITTAA